MKKKKIMTGVAATVLTLSVATPTLAETDVEKKEELKCNDWKLNQETNAYECKESGSSSHGHFFYMGGYYNNQSALVNSQSYKNTQSRIQKRNLAKASISTKSGNKAVVNSGKVNAGKANSVQAKPKTSVNGKVSGSARVGSGNVGAFGG